MGDFYMAPVCYDEIAERDGKEAAQELWEKNGGTGKFVNGMIARCHLEITDGLVIHGQFEPKRR